MKALLTAAALALAFTAPAAEARVAQHTKAHQATSAKAAPTAGKKATHKAKHKKQGKKGKKAV